MSSTGTTITNTSELRRKAEEIAVSRSVATESVSDDLDCKRMLHELQVHQIELETQNKELRRTQLDLDAINFRNFYLYNLAPIAYIHLTVEGVIDENNSSAAKMFGVGHNDLLKNPFIKYIFCEEQDKYLKHREKFFKPHDNQGLDIRMVRADGSLFWILLQALPADTGDCWITLSNITDRKRVEEALIASEERHRTILKTAMDGYWLVGADGRIIEVNTAYCDMSGYTEQELLSMSVSDVEDKETAEVTSDHIQKVMEQGQDRFESRHRRKDGTFFDVEVSTQYQSLGSGFFVSFLRDITEHKHVEERRDHHY